jgi:methyl-accepting chemotaxis protein
MNDWWEHTLASSRSACGSPAPGCYKQELDPEGLPQFGLVAEQVEHVKPDLAARDEDGKVSTVRYETVNAMLLNKFLRQHRVVQEQQGTIGEVKSTAARQEATIAKQEAMIAQQHKQIESLTAGLQKVSDKLELAKPAPRLVANGQ